MKLRYLPLMLMAFLLVAGQALAGDSLRDLFKKVGSSVCVLKTHGSQASSSGEKGPARDYGLGSGVLISSDGKVLTAAHVVNLADAVVAEFASGEKIPATVVSTVPPADVALLQLERMPTDVAPAVLGDSDLMQVGDRVMIVGAPFGLGNTMSAGYLSGRHKLSEQLESLVDVEILQTDAAANKGNSGGPMFNMNGEVVGIVSAILTRSGGFDGISMVISSNVSRNLLLEEKAPWFGLDAVILEKYAAAFNVPQKAGLLVKHVAEGSIADALDLKGGDKVIKIGKRELLIGGDVILEVAGIVVTSDLENLKKIRKTILEMERGDTLAVKVLRAGKFHKLSTVLE